jgi:hypothetical protein
MTAMQALRGLSFATAVATLLFGCASPGTTPTAGPPSSSATLPPATAQPSVELPLLPGLLRHLWLRDPHPVPGLAAEPNAAALDLTETLMYFYPFVKDGRALEKALASTARIEPDGEVVFDLLRDQAGCKAKDHGTYRVKTAADGLTMTLEAAGDPCAARSAAVTGTWVRSACPNHGQWCLGDLEAGPHVSANYTPLVPFVDWTFDYGRLAYTVPAGWSNPEDTQDGYFLRPTHAPDGAGLWLFSDVLAHAQTKDCRSAPAPGVGTSAAAIYDWIRARPGLKVTHASRDASVGGLRGYSLDLAVDAAHAGECSWNPGHKSVALFVNAQSTPEDGFDWGIGEDGRMRLFILELPPTPSLPDRTLVIDIEALDGPAWSALLPEAMPVVQSFEFRR